MELNAEDTKTVNSLLDDPSPDSRDGDVTGASIVIPVINQIEMTRACLEGIRDCTTLPHEVIVVDNASTDGSADLCESMGCLVLRNPENIGCARAWNQGISMASYPHIVLMNNDIVVTHGWLEDLIDFQDSHHLGLVSPSIIEGRLDYDLQSVAESFTGTFGDRWRPGWHASCFLLSRNTLDTVGMFDERFARGGYEDDDFDIRLGLVGMRTGTSGSVLVHHYGQITQKAVAGNTWKVVRNPNKTVLEEKWGWRLVLRRGRKEIRRTWDRIRFGSHGVRDPRDVFLVRSHEGLDIKRGRKTVPVQDGERIRIQTVTPDDVI